MGYKPIPTHGMVCIIWECGSFLISRFVSFFYKKRFESYWGNKQHALIYSLLNKMAECVTKYNVHFLDAWGVFARND